MKHSRASGFTLLELMVVLAIIGTLLGMTTLSVNQHKTLDDAKEFAQNLTAYLSALRDEASFQNMDLGLLLEVHEIQLLRYYPPKVKTPEPKEVQSFSANVPDEQNEEHKPWKAYSGRLKSTLKMPEGMMLRLQLEGKEIDLERILGDKELKPSLLFLSSDEYTPFTLFIEHEQDQSFSVSISGDGLSDFDVQTERLDEQD